MKISDSSRKEWRDGMDFRETPDNDDNATHLEYLLTSWVPSDKERMSNGPPLV